ncbi:MAG TPA: L-threonylcarbamoyladenylate synthase [Gaiellaceae bacterium]|jgi:L-threonylcarbamoyladenylate synthase|nr:L-threonylcarbamoyladenylate synthase [Gaiellaceae bacterium]
MSVVHEAVAALRAGNPVVLPFDTVYGLAADPDGEEPTRRLYRLKGRPATQPSALVARDLEYLLERVPELRGRSEALARQLLPGPYTLIFPNPRQRFPWLTGANPATIGVRVPNVAGVGADVLARVGAVVATSANRPGEPDPATLADVPAVIRSAVVAVDGGALPGSPSTVLDLSGDEPRVLREGAASASEALRRLRAPVRSC